MFIIEKFKKFIMLVLIICFIVNFEGCSARKNRKNYKLKSILLEFQRKGSNFHKTFDFTSVKNSSNYDRNLKIENYLNYKDVYGIRYVEPTKKQSNETIESDGNFYTVEKAERPGTSAGYNQSSNYSQENGAPGGGTMYNPDSSQSMGTESLENYDISSYTGTRATLTNPEPSSNKKPLKQKVQNFPARGNLQSATISTVNDLKPPGSVNLMTQEYNPEITNPQSQLPNPQVSNSQLIRPQTPPGHHIMKPSGKLEHTLHILAARLKQLLVPYLVREEGKSAQLTSLGQLLNIFRIVKFDNLPCVTASRPLTQLVGTCYHDTDCARLGGQGVGTCAAGFGVCCVCKSFLFR